MFRRPPGALHQSRDARTLLSWSRLRRRLLALSADKKEGAKGIPYTTDWKAAIKEAKNTGKMILIYNGWQRERI